MRIFVGFGFNERDKWVKEMVFPIIKAFDAEVLTGEEIYGEVLTEGVRNEIARADAVIGFRTRRGEPNAEGIWDTHRWVSDELLLGQERGLSVLEVREKGVSTQNGALGDRQRIDYEEGKRDVCLVELVKAIGNWHKGGSVRFQLLPQEFSNEIFPYLSNPGLRCVYRYMTEDDDRESQDFPAKIRRIDNGLYVRAKDVPRGALIEVQVECRGNIWGSGYVSTDSLTINLSKQ